MSDIRNEYGKTWALVQEIADLQEEIKREREQRVIILYLDIRAGTNLLARHDAGIQQLEKRLKELQALRAGDQGVSSRTRPLGGLL